MSEPTLDEQFLELRRLVDREIAGARRQTTRELAQALARMRDAPGTVEFEATLAQARERFSDDPWALECLAAFAALTAPVASERPQEASARRFAKVKIAEIRLYQAAQVNAGRAAHNLYGALKPQIDRARESFAQRFLSNGTRTADYLHSEFVRALANDDATLLGPDYPGPLA